MRREHHSRAEEGDCSWEKSQGTCQAWRHRLQRAQGEEAGRPCHWEWSLLLGASHPRSDDYTLHSDSAVHGSAEDARRETVQHWQAANTKAAARWAGSEVLDEAGEDRHGPARRWPQQGAPPPTPNATRSHLERADLAGASSAALVADFAFEEDWRIEAGGEDYIAVDGEDLGIEVGSYSYAVGRKLSGARGALCQREAVEEVVEAHSLEQVRQILQSHRMYCHQIGIRLVVYNSAEDSSCCSHSLS